MTTGQATTKNTNTSAHAHTLWLASLQSMGSSA